MEQVWAKTTQKILCLSQSRQAPAGYSCLPAALLNDSPMHGIPSIYISCRPNHSRNHSISFCFCSCSGCSSISNMYIEQAKQTSIMILQSTVFINFIFCDHEIILLIGNCCTFMSLFLYFFFIIKTAHPLSSHPYVPN